MPEKYLRHNPQNFGDFALYRDSDARKGWAATFRCGQQKTAAERIATPLDSPSTQGSKQCLPPMLVLKAPKPNRRARMFIPESPIASLKNWRRGVLPWLKPWNAEHAAGRICRPLRFNGQSYSGVNVLTLWAEAETRGYSCPLWMTFQQALALGGHVRKGQHGAPVVYASRFTKTETTAAGDEIEREIPFLRQYWVFNCEQIDGLPASFYQPAEQPKTKLERVANADAFFAATGRTFATVVIRLITRWVAITSKCRRLNASAMPKATAPRWRMS